MRRIAAALIPALLLFPTAPQAAGALPLAARPAPFSPVSVDRNKTRIFLPLHHAEILSRHAKVGSWEMELLSETPGTYAFERAVPHSVLRYLRIEIFEKHTYIHADWRYAAQVQVRLSDRGVEITFHNRSATPGFQTMAAGVRYWEGQRWTSGGPVRLHLLTLDPKKVQLVPALAHSHGHLGLATVSSLARHSHAIAAINAGYFSPRTGEPQGALVLNHTPVARAMLNRPSLCLSADGAAFIKVEKPVVFLRRPDGKGLSAQVINERARHDRLTIYTPHWGISTRTYEDDSRWEMAISPTGEVVGEGYGNLQIPRGGYVASAQGSAIYSLKQLFCFGLPAQVSFSLSPRIQNAIGGGPTLIEDNRIAILAHEQRFHADVTAGRQPRTAIGITRDGHYLLLCADGRRPGYSVGLTLRELANTLKEFGAVQAMNLDGGGSTTMWLHGHTINRPSDGCERAVSTALLVLPRNPRVARALDGMLAADCP